MIMINVPASGSHSLAWIRCGLLVISLGFSKFAGPITAISFIAPKMPSYYKINKEKRKREMPFYQSVA